MARQGFKYESDTPYIYQEDIGNDSAALGIDPASGGVYKIKVQSTAGADVSGTYQVQIDPAANGDIDLNPNGSGSVNVSTAVNLPHADNGSAQGYITFNDIRWAHNYGDDNTFVGENAGNNTLTPASSLGNTCIGALAGSSLTTSSLNTLVGQSAGINITDGNNNTAVGQGALGSTSGANSTAIGFNALAAYNPILFPFPTGTVAVGFNCLQSVVNGFNNCFMGYECGQNLTTSDNNTVIGSFALDNSISVGANNVIIGYAAADTTNLSVYNVIIGATSGQALDAGSESSNIIILNAGISGDSNTIRLGTQGSSNGQQNRCFIAGITGVNVGSVSNVVSIDTGTGQLGTTAITAGTGISVTPGANTITIASTGSSLSAYTSVNTTPYTVLAGDQFLGVDSSGASITIELPDAPATGRAYSIKDSTGSANTNNILVTTVGGAVTIDGVTTYTMNINYQSINVIFNGTSYEIW